MPPTTLVKPSVGEPTKKQKFADLVIDWINYLYGVIAGSIGFSVVNGGFEGTNDFDTGSGGWVFTPYPSGSGAVDTTTQAEGLTSFKIVVPGGGGNGGGYLESASLIAISNLKDVWLKWKYKVSVATTSNQVELRWFDSAGSYVDTTIIWSASSGQSTSWAQQWGRVLSASIPSTARFVKVRLTGGSVGSAAGNVWYDDVEFFTPGLKGQSQVFNTTGTFTPPADTFMVQVKMWGAGGGGHTFGTTSPGGSGGGGGYVEGYLKVVPGVPITVTVGVGGVVNGSGSGSSMISDGVTLAAGGGAVGSISPVPAPGNGGSASGGYLNIRGKNGGDSPLGGYGGGATNVPGYAPGGGAGGAVGTSSALGAAGKVIILY